MRWLSVSSATDGFACTAAEVAKAAASASAAASGSMRRRRCISLSFLAAIAMRPVAATVAQVGKSTLACDPISGKAA
jgi:hypothetical protein